MYLRLHLRLQVLALASGVLVLALALGVLVLVFALGVLVLALVPKVSYLRLSPFISGHLRLSPFVSSCCLVSAEFPSKGRYNRAYGHNHRSRHRRDAYARRPLRTRKPQAHLP